MALKLLDKQRIVEEVSAQAETALSVVVAEYSGLSVGELTNLRAAAKEVNVNVRVVKNTLAKRAFAETDYNTLDGVLKGQVILAFSNDSPGDAAKVFKAFSAKQEKLNVVGLSLGGELLAPSQLAAVAELPNRDEAISLLMAVMQAPVTKLARTFNEVPGKLVRTVEAIKQAKDAA